jgi:CHAT domain-containing protein/tetratricopeptide (TPR) repeat protein
VIVRACAAVLLAAATSAQQALEYGRNDVEVTAGEESRFALPAIDFEGRVYLWARSTGLDPRIEVFEVGGGSLAADDDNGGGTTAWAMVDVRPELRLEVAVSAAGDDARGPVELHVVAERMTPELRAAGQEGQALLAEVGRLLRVGRAGEEQQAVTEYVRRWMELPEAETSAALSTLVMRLVRVVEDAGDFDTAVPVYRRLRAVWTRIGSETHFFSIAMGTTLIQLEFLRGDGEESLRVGRDLLAVADRHGGIDRIQTGFIHLQASTVLAELGRLAEARAEAERCLADFEEGDGDEGHLDLARGSIAHVCALEGDLLAARHLYEESLAWLRGRGASGAEIVGTLSGLAQTLLALGQFTQGAVLFEEALVELESQFGARHPAVLNGRVNLASALSAMGREAEALALSEAVLDGYVPGRDPEGAWIDLALEARANSLAKAGRHADAQDLLRSMLRDRAPRFPEGSVARERLLHNLATSLGESGRLDEAAALLEESLRDAGAAASRVARANRALLMWIRHAGGDDDGARAAGAALLDEVQATATLWVASSSPAEVEEQATLLRHVTWTVLSIARETSAAGAGVDELQRRALELLESLRSLGTWAGAIAADGAPDAATEALRTRVREASARLVALARGGADTAQLVEARRAADVARRELLNASNQTKLRERMSGGTRLTDVARGLTAGRAVVLYHRLVTARLADDQTCRTETADRFVAVVVAPETRTNDTGGDSEWQLVDLGDAATIESAVAAWRASLRDGADGEVERGHALRALVVDPVLAATGDFERIECIPDDVLHLVPLDALPNGDERLGDSIAVHVRTTLRPRATRPAPESSGVLAVGGVQYGVAGAGEGSAGTLRGSPWEDGFRPLPGTAREVQALSELVMETDPGGAGAVVLSGADATRAAFFEHASTARYLHVATHGWFSTQLATHVAEGRRDRSVLPAQSSIRWLSPLSLCGLALAGANAAPDRMGRAPGLLTAEELAALDLSRCELAVLSACDTGVGLTTSGTGVSSLQKALHVAGARAVVTSLWKVDDDAARELMIAFYRALWVDRQPVRAALWHAKSVLRAQRLPARAWAGWVLTE